MNGDYALNLKEIERQGGIVIKIAEISDASAGTSGNTHSSPIDAMVFKEGNFFLNVTTLSGTTKSFTPKIVTKDPSADKWHEVVAFSEATDVGAEMKVAAANLGNKLSVEYLKDTASTVVATIWAVLKTK